jgi:hypothetical protein
MVLGLLFEKHQLMSGSSWLLLIFFYHPLLAFAWRFDMIMGMGYLGTRNNYNLPPVYVSNPTSLSSCSNVIVPKHL